MTRDMTTGSPLKHIFLFFIPVFIGNLFQQLYNLADTVILGRFDGSGAFAAVGSVGSLVFLVIGFAIGMCSGFGVQIARYFGTQDYEKMRKCIANQVILSIIISILLMTISLIGANGILHIMNTPDDLIEDAYIYIMILFAGIPITMFYNFLASICRAVGDSRTPLLFLIVASLINIGLDLLFIVSFNMGTAGVGYATIIAQFISGISCLFYMYFRYPELHLSKQDFHPDSSLMTYSLYMGFPMALQFSITAIGAIILQGAVNSLGTSVVTAITAAQKIQMLLNQPMDAMGATMATYTSQNLGAGRIDRIREGIKKALLVILVMGVISAILVNVAGVSISKWFVTDAEPEIFEMIAQFFLYNGLFYCALGLLSVLRNAVQGMGFSLPAMLAGVMELISRVVIGVFFVGVFGFTAVCFANPLSWLSAGLFMVPVYFRARTVLEHRFPPRPDI